MRYAAWLMALTIASIAGAYAAQSNGVATWLPRVGNGFDPSSHGQAAWSREYDYFLCSGSPVASATPFANFDYALRGCGALKSGTYFTHGSTEPIKAHVLYDAAHKLVLYQEGCCAWRTTVLASGIGSPPASVHGADLSDVRTARRVSLGMTQRQVIEIYGASKPHAVGGDAGVTMLSYTTMHGNPSSTENACGQFQNFAFRNGKLFYIELLAGC
jgi:hypothetical protein